MGIAIPGKTVFLIETAPCSKCFHRGFVLCNIPGNIACDNGPSQQIGASVCSGNFRVHDVLIWHHLEFTMCPTNTNVIFRCVILNDTQITHSQTHGKHTNALSIIAHKSYFCAGTQYIARAQLRKTQWRFINSNLLGIFKFTVRLSLISVKLSSMYFVTSLREWLAQIQTGEHALRAHDAIKNVLMTSKRRHVVVSTSWWRY